MRHRDVKKGRGWAGGCTVAPSVHERSRNVFKNRAARKRRARAEHRRSVAPQGVCRSRRCRSPARLVERAETTLGPRCEYWQCRRRGEIALSRPSQASSLTPGGRLTRSERTCLSCVAMTMTSTPSKVFSIFEVTLTRWIYLLGNWRARPVRTDGAVPGRRRYRGSVSDSSFTHKVLWEGDLDPVDKVAAARMVQEVAGTVSGVAGVRVSTGAFAHAAANAGAASAA